MINYIVVSALLVNVLILIFLRGATNMKPRMSDYVNKMSGDDIEAFENIITNQYKKFIRFFKLVSKYSDEIDDLHYVFNSSNELEVDLIFVKGTDVAKIEKKISSKISELDYEAEICIKKKTISIKIFLDED